jgi:AraC family transcriptional regulator, melibiose operon regulatory protein
MVGLLGSLAAPPDRLCARHKLCLVDPAARHVLAHGPASRIDQTDDTHLFEQWTNDGQDLNPERARILELELEARLRRLVLGKATRSTNARSRKVAPIGQAERMAQFIGEHHLEQIGLREIARVVGLNPNYAAGLFKQTFAMTILEYLTQHRVALAQRLLATTHSSVLEIAFASGFGSSSQFYVAFERATGQSPLEYRRAMGGKRN